MFNVRDGTKNSMGLSSDMEANWDREEKNSLKESLTNAHVALQEIKYPNKNS